MVLPLAAIASTEFATAIEKRPNSSSNVRHGPAGNAIKLPWSALIVGKAAAGLSGSIRSGAAACDVKQARLAREDTSLQGRHEGQLRRAPPHGEDIGCAGGHVVCLMSREYFALRFYTANQTVGQAKIGSATRHAVITSSPRPADFRGDSVMKQICGLLLERGLVTPEDKAKLSARLDELPGEENSPITPRIWLPVRQTREKWRSLDQRIGALDAEFAEQAREDARMSRLLLVPGIGALNAPAPISAIGDARAFARGRDLGHLRTFTLRKGSNTQTSQTERQSSDRTVLAAIAAPFNPKI